MLVPLSKRHLDKAIEERLFEVFWQSIADLTNPKQAEQFFTDLFSPTEKLMLAKRLGIALMLLKGDSYAAISETLKVSTTTVMHVNQWLKGGKGGYEEVIQKVLKKEQWELFMSTIDKHLATILPPRRGSNWSAERSKQWHTRTKRTQQLSSL